MKIISWNVNWLRAVAKKWFKDFVVESKPDILCLQETKAFEEQFLKDVWKLDWYKYVWHAGERSGYAGTAIFFKEDLFIINTRKYFDWIEDFHSDWRLTEIETNDFILLNWYFPNGWKRADWTEMLGYKLDFYDKIISYSNRIVESWKNVIIAWDFNICHTEIDISRPKENENSIWFLPIERSKIWELLDNWYIDVWRNFNPGKKDVYSWWSYRAWARPRNVGWRIDYFMVNKDFIEKIDYMDYMTDIMWSDHCPLFIELKD